MNRETYLENAISELRPLFKAQGATIPKRVRVTCGPPSKRAGRSSKRRVGECWAPEASADKTVEIIISMVIDKPVQALDILTHELVHASVGNKCGHKGPFRKLALALGLTGKMTATVAGEKLTKQLKTIVKKLGRFPHAKLDLDSRTRQSTRLLKAKCCDVDCGMIFRTTNKWLEIRGTFDCPICHTICEVG
jgi:hypothetical protein